MDINVKKTEVMRISTKASTLQVMIDETQLENVEYFKYLGSVVTNDARCTREIKSRVAMAKAVFKRKKTLSQANWT